MSLSTLLRHTRHGTGLSQHRLALDLGISQRHVSFLESGRAAPSRKLMLAWMDAVRAPPSIRNAALIQAGFGQHDTGSAGDPIAPPAARAALSRILAAHEPFPGFTFDGDWIMRDRNRGAQWLCAVVMPEYWAAVQRREGGVDIVDALIHPAGMLSCIREPQVAGYRMLRQLRVEEWVRPSLKGRADALEAALAQRFGPPTDHVGRDDVATHMMVRFESAAGQLSFYTLESVFGLPQDVTIGSIRVELWFPADRTTRELLLDDTAGPGCAVLDEAGEPGGCTGMPGSRA